MIVVITQRIGFSGRILLLGCGSVGRDIETVRDYERARRRPPPDVLGALASTLGVPVDAFFEGARDAAAG
jgi:transcriptional regulator with XRE-family HTH domain